MKRSEIKRKTPMARGTSKLKRTKLKQRSETRQTFMKETRAPAVEALVASGETCQVGPILHAAHLFSPCVKQIGGLHERRKRSSGGSLVNPDNLLPACNPCNGYIEDQPRLVRRLTGTKLIVREGDAEWSHLGKRADP